VIDLVEGRDRTRVLHRGRRSVASGRAATEP